MTLGRWTSLGLALIGAGCLVGIYGVTSHSTAAAAGGRVLSTPIQVVAQPSPSYAVQPATEIGVTAAWPFETRAEVGDDQDGVEPRSMVGNGMVVDCSPAEGWMRRLNIARELLRQGAEQSARMSFERIIGEAQVCRAYQYALVDLAAVELYRGRVESARQLLDEVSESDRDLPLDSLTSGRIHSIRAELTLQAFDETGAF